MLKTRTQQHIRFAKIEKPHAWFIVAVLFETTGSETVAISEPKIVKIIYKAQYLLTGKTKKQAAVVLLSNTHAQKNQNILKRHVISSYSKAFFGNIKSYSVIGLAAQPPTR